MSDQSLLLAIINAIAPILAAVAACGAVFVSWRNGRKVDATCRKLDAADEKIEVIRETSKRSVEELDLMATGAHWKGYHEGVQAEKKRASGFGHLDVEDWRG